MEEDGEGGLECILKQQIPAALTHTAKSSLVGVCFPFLPPPPPTPLCSFSFSGINLGLGRVPLVLGKCEQPLAGSEEKGQTAHSGFQLPTCTKCQRKPRISLRFERPRGGQEGRGGDPPGLLQPKGCLNPAKLLWEVSARLTSSHSSAGEGATASSPEAS